MGTMYLEICRLQREVEERIMLETMKPNKKYGMLKLQKLIAKNGIRWGYGRVLMVANRLYEKGKVTRTVRNKKIFIKKPIDK